MAPPNQGAVEMILGRFREQSASKVVVAGCAGAGKTWVARKVCNSALRQGLSYGSVWIIPAENSEKLGLLDIIASQLSLSSGADGEDIEDTEDMEPSMLKQRILDKLETMRTGKDKNQAPLTVKETLEEIEEKKSKGHRCLKLDTMITWRPKTQSLKEVKETPEEMEDNEFEDLAQEATLMGKGEYLIVVLEDTTMEEEDSTVTELEEILGPNHLKILVTRKVSRDSNAAATSEGEEQNIQPHEPTPIQLDPLSPGEAVALLKERFPARIQNELSKNQKLEAIAGKASGLPAAIILMAEALKHISLQDGDRMRESAVEDLANLKGDDITGVLRLAYGVLPEGVTRSCYWLSRQLFLHRHAVDFNELIAYWILEGCFDHHNRIAKAYAEGHHILMDLKDRGILKGHSNYVYFERTMLDLPDERKNGFSGAMKLGLADAMMNNGLGRITFVDGMIRTVCRDKEKRDLSTLIIDGIRLREEAFENTFKSLTGLKVLAVLNPMFEFLPPGLTESEDLQVLVLRGCQRLKKADEITKLTKLQVLEISGASLLRDIDKYLFKDMSNLKSINLSGLPVESIPASLFDRGEVRFLIIRDCPDFVELPSLRHMKKLQMVDLCGSALFERLGDGTLSPLTDLKTLNLSGTKVRNLPILGKLTGVTRMLMSDCLMLTMVRSLREMTNLEVLDISGSTGIKDLNSAQLQNKGRFRILDLSKTGIVSLPANISNLSYLNLNDCCELPKLPSTNAFLDLVVLDLSGALKLAELSDTSFEHLKFLRELNLTGTQIEKLPSLSHLVELRELVLKDCKKLTELQGLSPLEKLEVLDLSGCCSLTNIGEASFKAMSRLKKLDLSETKIESLPEDCFPSNLCHLILRDCKILKQLPSLGSLSKLEELDLGGAESLAKFKADFLQYMTKLEILKLSKTQVEDLPSLSLLTNLRELCLSGCSCVPSGLEALKELRVLDLSSTKVQSLLTLRNHSKLRELLLNNCSDLSTISNLESLSLLEVLSLSGTGLKSFPDEAIHLPYLRQLHLPNLKQTQVDWSKIKHLPADINWDTCFKESKTDTTAVATTKSQSPSILVRGTKFFSFLKENPELWVTCFKEFHFSVWIPDAEGGDEIMKVPGDMSLFKYLNPRERFPGSGSCSLLEIHGPCDDDFSSELQNAVGRAQYISLIDNATISCISDLGKEKGIFSRLKNLHLEYCPELVSIFSSSELPVNLETLRVKFCKKLGILFGGDESDECKMPKLKTLELFDLPELKKIGCSSAHLKTSEMVKTVNCFRLDNGSSSSQIAGKVGA